MSQGLISPFQTPVTFGTTTLLQTVTMPGLALHHSFEYVLILFLADNGGCAEEFPATGQPKALHIPTATRDGRPMRPGNNPEILPSPEDTYQSYGILWANASDTLFRLYKHWVQEGGIATPLIAHWPAVIQKRNSLTDQPGHLVDIMATYLEGKSLLPVFQGKQRRGHEEIFWEHEGNRAVRQGKWKLVSRYPDKMGAL